MFQINLQVRSFQYIVLNNSHVFILTNDAGKTNNDEAYREPFIPRSQDTRQTLHADYSIHSVLFKLLIGINVNRKLLTDSFSHWYTARSGVGNASNRATLPHSTTQGMRNTVCR